MLIIALKSITKTILKTFMATTLRQDHVGVSYINEVESNHCIVNGELDQGALGMSDPCGTLPLALKPNAVPRINCLLSNFYFCAN